MMFKRCSTCWRKIIVLPFVVSLAVRFRIRRQLSALPSLGLFYLYPHVDTAVIRFRGQAQVQRMTSRVLSHSATSGTNQDFPYERSPDSSLADHDVDVFQTAEEAYDFWFYHGADDEHKSGSCLNSAAYLKAAQGRWFMGSSPTLEQRMKAQKEIIEKLAALRIDDDAGGRWPCSPRGLLARIILLDQGSRSAFRGTVAAFQFDAVAINISKHILTHCNDWYMNECTPAERLFVLMPLQHSEDVEAHELAAQRLEQFFAGAPDEAAAAMGGVASFFKEHYDVIKQFGRYPSRNDALVNLISLLDMLCSIKSFILMVPTL